MVEAVREIPLEPQVLDSMVVVHYLELVEAEEVEQISQVVHLRLGGLEAQQTLGPLAVEPPAVKLLGQQVELE